MSNKVKLEHYVPRCYLKNFSITGKDDFLFCFDKVKSRTFKVNSKNIACESAFYDTCEDGDQRVEKTLSYLELLFDTACRKLLTTEDFSSLSDYDLLYLARFIATQDFRTKERRTRIKKSYERLLEHSRSSLAKQSVEFQKGMLSLRHQLSNDEGVKSLHLEQLQNIESIMVMFLEMAWVLLVNCTSLPFWCSDHPVNYYFQGDISPFGNFGLKDGRIHGYLPLSPRICLCFSSATVDGSLRSECELQDTRQVIYQNYLQVVGSTRYVFSNKGDLSILEQIAAYTDTSLLRKP